MDRTETPQNDKSWIERAVEAKRRGFMGTKESERFLTEVMKENPAQPKPGGR